MAKVAIRFAESALADLESIRDWYAEQDVPGMGERLIGEIVAGIEALADHPDMGRIVPEFNQFFLRELIRPPFRVVYRRDPKHVRVVRVWRNVVARSNETCERDWLSAPS
jgi:Plasmid stabilization system protein